MASCKLVHHRFTVCQLHGGEGWSSKVDEYARIRHAHATEMVGIRELARRFHHSRRTIREILGHPAPRPYPRREPAPSILDPFKPTIDAILKADEQAPRKQRHTAAKIFRRLRDEHGYQGGEERVRLYLRGQPSRGVETFIPLNHDPGQRAECDFGHIDFPDGRQQVPVLLALLFRFPSLRRPLRTALAKTASEEVKQRLERILESNGEPTSADMMRIRVLAAVDLSNKPVARRLLEEWAAGTAAHTLTIEAKLGLDRRRP